MIQVGIVGLDTSHADAFAALLDRRRDASIAGVWDGGDVRDSGYAESFCERYGATRMRDVEAMPDAVDAAMVLGADWTRHAALARPFLEAGVATLVDKPIAGDMADVRALRASAAGASLFGGSAVSFHPEFDALPVDYSGRQVYGAGFNDPFYYGGHVVDPVRTIVGADWISVSPSEDRGETVTVLFENDACATLRLDGPDRESSFAFLDVSDVTRTVRIGGDEREPLYEPYLDAYLAAVRGDRDDTDRVLDAASLLLAVHVALRDGRPVTPHSDALEAVSVDAAPFLETYEPPS